MAVDEQKAEPETDYHVPSHYLRCRRKVGATAYCSAAPVADMRRQRYVWRDRRFVNSWWAYCADHLADYNREVRDGRVWRRGIEAAHAD